MKKVFIAMGGTGGHVIPAMSLGEELAKKEGVSIEYIGVGLDTNAYFAREGNDYTTLDGANFSKGVLFGLKKIVKGFRAARKRLKAQRPDRVVGFGSFHSLPAMLAALSLRIPFDIVELNTLPGKINRLFSYLAKRCYIHFDPSREWLKGQVIPIDYSISKPSEISKKEALHCFGLGNEKKTVFIFGGSQGAEAITDAWLTFCTQYKDSLQVIHMTKKVDEVLSFYKENNIDAFVSPFIEKIDLAYQAADFCICRSGAGALREALQYSKPSIFVPFPISMEDHQKKNALYMQDTVGGGVMVCEGEGFAKRLEDTVELFLAKDEKKIKDMQSSLIRHKEEHVRTNLVESIRSTL